jgi:MFS transporter, SP family, arabinose:H+ symporter
MAHNTFLYRSAAVGSLAGFLFGFDTVVISGAEQAIQTLWSLDSRIHGLTISMALWGTVVGALFGGWPAEHFGRKKTLIWVGVLFFISAIASALAQEVYSFMIARFIGGVGIGIATVAAPMYISEISPPEYRGRLTGLFQFNIVFGILVAYLSNSLIKDTGQNDWRWMLGVMSFPAAAFTFLSLSLPESPRWLILHKGDRENGFKVLKRINQKCTETEIGSIVDEILSTGNGNKLKKAFFSRRLIKPIFLAFFIAFFNQMSGINAILYYAPRIFSLTGSDTQAAFFQSVGIGLVNLVFTFAGLWLIDRLGRRVLLYIGSFGYITSLGLISWAFYSGNTGIVPLFILTFIASHAIGQGAVIWVFISEIFPNKERAFGQSLGSFTHWFFAATITLIFPYMVKAFHPGWIFGFFCGMMVLQLIWVALFVPETKGIALEQMEKKLH